MSVFHSRTELVEVGQEECLRLLRTRRVGRVAFVADGHPLILPVNYAVDAATIVIRTDRGTKLASMPLTNVAFEVDDIDEVGAQGWDVVVQGHADDITDSIDRRSEVLRALRIDTFAPGMKWHWIRISPTTISGRRLVAR